MSVLEWLSLLVPWFSIFACWVLLLGILTGLGLVTCRLFGIQHWQVSQAPLLPWIGLGALLCLLQIWHLILSVQSGFWLFAILPAIFGWWSSRSRLHKLFRTIPWQELRFSLFLLLFLGLYLSHLAEGLPKHWDSGLYHLPTVEWLKQYPIVPGLANLHGRLGFNHSYFLFVSALDVFPGGIAGHHLANGFLLWLLLAWSVSCLAQLSKSRDKTALWVCVLAFACGPLLEQVWSLSLSSPTPDLPLFLFGFLLLRGLLRLLDEAPLEKESLRFEVLSLIVLALTGWIIKLSFVIPALLCLSLCFWGIRRQAGFGLKTALSFLMLVSLALLLPWAIRGLLLSGYMTFPVPWPDLGLSWAVPERQAWDEVYWIRSWARRPGPHWSQVLGNWDWLEGWFRILLKRHHYDVILPLVLAGIGLLNCLVLRLRNTDSGFSLAWLIPMALLLQLLAWFFQAPNPRFAGSVFWALAASVWALSWRGLNRTAVDETFDTQDKSRPLTLLLGFALVQAAIPVFWFLAPELPALLALVIFLSLGLPLVAMRKVWALQALESFFWLELFAISCFFGGAWGALAGLVLSTSQLNELWRRWPMRSAFQGMVLLLCWHLVFSTVLLHRSLALWRTPGNIQRQAVPQPELKSFQTTSGLLLLVPREKDQCWKAPLPCTPYPEKGLSLRQPGFLGSGFYVQGPLKRLGEGLETKNMP